MTSIKDITNQGRLVSAKVAAGYTTYLAAKKAAERVADTLAAVWKVDADLSYDRYQAAKRVIHHNIRTLPGISRKETDMSGGDGDHNLPYRTNGWVFVDLPGAPIMQARDMGSWIEFRTARKRDLEAAKKAVDADTEESTDYEVNIDTFGMDMDFMPQTNILAWTKNGWDFRKSRSARSFKSVILPAELQDAVEADLKAFTDSKARLQRLEIPWRRGYLFAGPPGTGKTSLSLAIAGALNFSLASLSLTDITSDGMLREAVSKLQPRTVLVIEDIDAYSVSRDRDHNTSSDGALSLSGLLNSLDGFETPDGLVTIATTNHADKLDPALKRSGRLDRTFTLDYIAATEVERLFKWFYEEDAPCCMPAYDVQDVAMAPAEATELFKQHLNDPQGGWNAVLERTNNRGCLAAA